VFRFCYWRFQISASRAEKNFLLAGCSCKVKPNLLAGRSAVNSKFLVQSRKRHAGILATGSRRHTRGEERGAQRLTWCFRECALQRGSGRRGNFHSASTGNAERSQRCTGVRRGNHRSVERMISRDSRVLRRIPYCTLSSSTSKIKVALGGMTPPAPRCP